MTCIIRITECAQCSFRLPYRYHEAKSFEYVCKLHTAPPLCPPTGTPDWFPLEMLEEKTDA